MTPTLRSHRVAIRSKTILSNAFGTSRLFWCSTTWTNPKTSQIRRLEAKYFKFVRHARGEIKDDSAKQIQAMDETRILIESWGDDVPEAYTFSDKFIIIEGYKLIR